MRLVFPLLISGVALSALAGCEPTYSEDTPAAPAAATCDATLFEELKGEPIESVDALSTPLTVRVLAADSFVPRDFDPNRLTFTESRDNTVSRIFCG